MIHLKFKINKYIILINSMIFEINKLLLVHLENQKSKDKYEVFIRKGTKIIIKKMQLICSWDNIEKIKYEFKKIKYIIEKNIDVISLTELEDIFEKNINNGREVFQTLKVMTIQPETNIVINEIELYKKELEKNWYKVLNTLNYYTESILNYNSDIKGIVYLVSNRYYIGQADLETKNVRIIYGSKFTAGNIIKDIIYIYHEILHNPILSYKKFDINKRKVHNVIKLIADNYLNCLLNKGSYFEINDDNSEIIKIYPYWLKFLYRNNCNMNRRMEYSIKRDLKTLSEQNYDVKFLSKYFDMVIYNNENIPSADIISFIKNIQT